MRPNLLKLLFHSKSLIFILCLGFSQHVFAQAPSNDSCANATVLTSSTTCSITSGTLVGANATTSVATICGSNSSPDVWYSFTARSANPTITLSSVGSNLTNISCIQLLSGTCVSYSVLNCIRANTLTATGLILGSTYYIRIHTINSTLLTSKAGFNICINE